MKYLNLLWKIIRTVVDGILILAFAGLASYGLHMVLVKQEFMGIILTLWFGIGFILLLSDEVDIWNNHS